jgi:uncharacterized protein YjbJ (UPF0337 family)
MSDTLQDKLQAGIDKVAGAGTADKAEGKIHEVIGQGKQSLGDALDNDKLKTDGVTEEIKGNVQQVSGGVQEKVEDVKEVVTGEPESLVEKIKEGAANIFDKIKDALDGDDNTPQKH